MTEQTLSILTFPGRLLPAARPAGTLLPDPIVLTHLLKAFGKTRQ